MNNDASMEINFHGCCFSIVTCRALINGCVMSPGVGAPLICKQIVTLSDGLFQIRQQVVPFYFLNEALAIFLCAFFGQSIKNCMPFFIELFLT